MSASSAILNQQNYSKVRQHADLLRVDPFNSVRAQSSVPVHKREIRKIPFVNAAPSFGSTVSCYLDGTNFCGDVYLKINLAATTPTYSAWPAMALIQNLKIECGSHKLFDGDYKAVMRHLLSTKVRTDEELTRFAALMGSTSSASQDIFAYIPVPWSRLMNGYMDDPSNEHFFNLGMLKTRIKITIELETSAAISSAGSAFALADPELWYAEYHTSEAIYNKSLENASNYVLHGSYFEENLANAVSDATSTTLDITGFSGESKGLILQSYLQSATEVYNVLLRIDYFKLKMDGKVYYETLEANEQLLVDQLFHQRLPDKTTLVNEQRMSWQLDSTDVRNHTGSLHLDAGKHLQLIVYSSGAGAAIYIDVLNERYEDYRINGAGQLVRASEG